MSQRKGKFIVLDGPDGSGKTTQMSLLRKALASRTGEVVVAREPGGTAIGEQVRRILLDPASKGMSEKTELFLYMACRAQIVLEVLGPAVARGAIVLCDRFLSSSIAYQGVAGGLGMENVSRIGEICIGEMRPDLTIILDVDAATSLQRRAQRSADRIEQRDQAYHERVRQGFLDLAATDPLRYKIVDASRSVNEVHREILRLVENVL